MRDGSQALDNDHGESTTCTLPAVCASRRRPLLAEGITRATAELDVGDTPLPPTTLIGVAALAEPDLMVEIEASAFID